MWWEPRLFIVAEVRARQTVCIGLLLLHLICSQDNKNGSEGPWEHPAISLLYHMTLNATILFQPVTKLPLNKLAHEEMQKLLQGETSSHLSP